MTDDIVTYLRLSQTRFNRHAEAADEIERLLLWIVHLLEGNTWCGQWQDKCDVCRIYKEGGAW